MISTVKEFEALATVIRSEQMPLAEMMILFRDEPKFAEWYKKKYFTAPEKPSRPS